jgi:hypothetical protein
MPKKTVAAKAKPASRAPARPRQLVLPKRIWYKPLTWRFKLPVPVYKPLPKARRIFASTLRQLWTHKGLFGGIIVIYGILNVFLVRSLTGSSNLAAVKLAIDSTVHGIGGHLLSSVGSFAYLLASSGSGNAQSSSAYQYLLLLFCSLAFIWAFRQVAAKNKVRIRDAFYHGMYPLVPFFLVFLVFCLQLSPAVLSGTAFSLATANHVATTGLEKLPFILLMLVCAWWSLRMITGTVFALYIVTLPDMTPLRAVRSAKKLVYGRRLLIWRKIGFLPFILFVLAALIELPLILFATPLASWVFFAFSMVALPVAHGYLYTLYREML